MPTLMACTFATNQHWVNNSTSFYPINTRLKPEAKMRGLMIFLGVQSTLKSFYKTKVDQK